MNVATEHIVGFKKSDEAKQIVFGEVYVPDRRDSDGNWMTRETVERMAHGFMAALRNAQINKDHEGPLNKGTVVESFIARDGDPDFIAGSWVVGVHIPDKEVWKQVMEGTLTGFSIEGTASLIEEEDGA